jgi:hypothetical protein
MGPWCGFGYSLRVRSRLDHQTGESLPQDHDLLAPMLHVGADFFELACRRVTAGLKVAEREIGQRPNGK